MPRRKIVVSREIVDIALQRNNHHCGIAMGIKLCDPNFVMPRVTQEGISFSDLATGQRLYFDTPPELAKWIDKFDRGQAGPITFDIDTDHPKKSRPIKHATPQKLAAISKRPRKPSSGKSSWVDGGNSAHRPLRED